jgi:hypothetical protein
MDPKLMLPVLVGLAACSSSQSIAPRSSAPRVTYEDPTVAQAIAHRREVRVEQDGYMDVVFVREDETGRRVEVDGADYVSRVAPSIRRMDDLPAPIDTWIASCPSLRDAVAEAVEQGATFRGVTRADGGVRGPYCWAKNDARTVECDTLDPLDTLVSFLLSAQDAAAASTNDAIDRDCSRGVMSRVEAREAVARVRAEHVSRVVALVQTNARCIGLYRLDPSCGTSYRLLEREVQGGRTDALAQRIAHDPELLGLTYAIR